MSPFRHEQFDRGQALLIVVIGFGDDEFFLIFLARISRITLFFDLTAKAFDPTFQDVLQDVRSIKPGLVRHGFVTFLKNLQVSPP